MCGVEGFCSGGEVVFEEFGDFLCQFSVDHDGGGLWYGGVADVCDQYVCAWEFGDVVDAAGVVESLFPVGGAADGIGESVSDFSDGVGDEPDASGERLVVEKCDRSFV